MRPWILCLVTISLGSIACEKAVRKERVVPATISPGGGEGGGKNGGQGVSNPSMDGGTTFDAGTAADDEEEIAPQEFTKRALLTAAGTCAVTRYERFREDAVRLRDATAAWAKRDTKETRDAARAAYLAANASWQVAEVFRFGPAARMMDDPAGKDLRDRIYAYPQDNPCMVDQRLVDRKYASAFDTILIGARGLSALEYLLFYTGEANACAAAIGINQTGAWAALDDGERRTRRAEYAQAVAKDILRQVDALRAAWSSDGGKFLDALSAGGGDAYEGEQAALNAVSHGLFYLEKEIKDFKLGLPLGLVEGCATATCPDAVEAPYASVSTSNLRENLNGWRRLFEGCGKNATGLGFDDWLRAVGASELADDMLSELNAAQTTVDDLDPPIEQSIVSDVAKVSAVHAAVKRLNDLLKTDFVTTLNLDLPMGAVGDND